jgi:hypothetical protein
MTTEQMNKEVWLWLDKKNCWHDLEYIDQGSYDVLHCKKCGEYADNPDFSQGAGIIRLLEEMMERGDKEDQEEFIVTHGELVYHRDKGWFRTIDVDYIITPGKLLKAVWEWSKEHPK